MVHNLTALHSGISVRELNIRNSYSTPRYPQSNGQAEATNKTLINALKKRLEQAKGKWVEELPGVLWAYRTTRTANRKHSFRLTYGMDAVIPTEIGLPTIRTDAAKQEDANIELGRIWTGQTKSEKRGHPDSRLSTKASAHYNRKVRPETSEMAQLQVFLLFLFIRNFCPEFDSLHPLAGLPHLPPHIGGPQLILLDSSAQPTPLGGLHFPLAWWIDWPQPPPFSDAADFQSLGAERRRSSYSLQSAAVE
ncbi:hypothetical protein CK203_097819 [Vitis vinifera]|uniref:Integrase catalytic domain-containing protein n=1 Tax=Vitis vinifera TaxID=29760 RepID=A0A438DFQ6_VITVI|nr:hypothetical protein CK203_097819 [Vitis vinifera]